MFHSFESDYSSTKESIKGQDKLENSPLTDSFVPLFCHISGMKQKRIFFLIIYERFLLEWRLVNMLINKKSVTYLPG